MSPATRTAVTASAPTWAQLAIALLAPPAVTAGLVVLCYAAFARWQPAEEYSSAAVLLVLALIGATALAQAWLGWRVPGFGGWLAYAVLATVAGFLLMAFAGGMYDPLRPAGVDPLGPAGMAFLLPMFVYALVFGGGTVVRVVVRR